MKNLFLTIVFLSLFGFNSCKDKDPKITKTIELSEEMMAYFVNYQVGTKWIYQDTIDKNNYDTIELILNGSYNVNDGGGTLTKGFELYFKPKKSKDFKLKVSPGINNSCLANIDPMVTAAGAISFEYSEIKWAHWITYYDSIEIKGNKYYSVIESNHNNMYQYYMKISKNIGIVFFIYNNVNPQNSFGAAYKLIKTIKP